MPPTTVKPRPKRLTHELRVRVEEGLHRRLSAHARENGTTESSETRRAILKLLREAEQS